MNYRDSEEDFYEDELDRMRARRRKGTTPLKKTGLQASYQSQEQSDELELEDWDDEDNTSYREDYEGEDYEEENRKGKDRQSGQTSVRKKQRKRRKKRRVLRILSILLIFLIGYFLYQHFRGDTYWTIAVFGVDSRDGKTERGALSDVEMLCTINQKTGEIRLASVFRDSYLRIDQDGDYDKINEAYFKGGHEQGVSALEDNLDLRIDDYATFNWKAVANAINILGGVDLEITDSEFAYINSFITETVESTGIGSFHLEHSGMNHLDGVQAVAYARLRLMDTDFNRTERQRKVLGLAMEKAKNADFATLTSLVGGVYPQVSTSIGLNDLMGIAKNVRKYYIGQTSGFPFSHQEMKLDGKSCVIPTTLESNVVQLHSFLYDVESYTVSDRVRSISNRIAELSGLGDPGKDTETGKNVGASGNSGQAAQPAPQTQAPAAESAVEEQTEAAETESTAESESESEESTEESVSETEETISPLESAESSSETGAATTPAPSTSAGPGTSHPNTSETPGAGSSESAGTAGNSGNSGTAGTTEAPAETHAALEAPGQGSGETSSASQGPGASN